MKRTGYKKVNRHRLAIIKRILRYTLSVLIVAAICLCNALFPIRSLLPADAIGDREEGELRVHFLYVGQGDMSIVEFPSGELLIIDGGEGSWTAQNRIIRYLKGLEPTKISYLVTHTDSDHIGRMDELVDLFGGETLYTPFRTSNRSAYQSLENVAVRRGLNFSSITRYGVIGDSSGAYLVCLSPRSLDDVYGNDSSTVLYLSYGETSFLFTGDISSSREAILVSEYSMDPTVFDKGEYRVDLNGVDVVKAAHHGSADSSSPMFTSLVKADYAVFSCGRGNTFGHPSEVAIKSYRQANENCKTLRTDMLGHIVASSDGSSVTVDTVSVEG